MTKERSQLHEIVGEMPNEHESKRRIRFHQGWWRAFVLNEPAGRNPADKDKSVCNTILSGDVTNKNFLSEAACKSVEATQIARKEFGAGLFNEDRLFNNLLSSQPLAFNFFGELKQDLELAKRIFAHYVPGLDEVSNVIFEYAPQERYTEDNSAFDVALEIKVNGQSGLLGLECKYTDTFSPTEYEKPAYRRVFSQDSGYLAPFEAYKASRFNQLFRNQLIASALIQHKKYAFVLTGLFCFEGDREAIQIGDEFQRMIRGGSEAFKVISYRDFISTAQRLELTWEQREWTMLLWARYCGLRLSAPLYGK
jgi:hypothetical protein